MALFSSNTPVTIMQPVDGTWSTFPVEPGYTYNPFEQVQDFMTTRRPNLPPPPSHDVQYPMHYPQPHQPQQGRAMQTGLPRQEPIRPSYTTSYFEPLTFGGAQMPVFSLQSSNAAQLSFPVDAGSSYNAFEQVPQYMTHRPSTQQALAMQHARHQGQSYQSHQAPPVQVGSSQQHEPSATSQRYPVLPSSAASAPTVVAAPAEPRQKEVRVTQYNIRSHQLHTCQNCDCEKTFIPWNVTPKSWKYCCTTCQRQMMNKKGNMRRKERAELKKEERERERLEKERLEREARRSEASRHVQPPQPSQSQTQLSGQPAPARSPVPKSRDFRRRGPRPGRYDFESRQLHVCTAPKCEKLFKPFEATPKSWNFCSQECGWRWQRQSKEEKAK